MPHTDDGDYSSDFRPDGKGLVFNHNVRKEGGEMPASLYTVDLDGKHRRKLTDSRNPCWVRRVVHAENEVNGLHASMHRFTRVLTGYPDDGNGNC